jgi:hypothetical protein
MKYEAGTYIEYFGGRFDFFVFKTEVDGGCREKSALLEGCVRLVWLAHVSDLLDHELDGCFRVPVLVHVGLLLVPHKERIQALHLSQIIV